MPPYDEEDLLAAITIYKRGDHMSISRTSRVSNIPRSTLYKRIFTRKPRKESYKNQ
jgi:predicted transcriptional regulator